MSLAQVSERHGRAVILLTALLTAAGALAVFSLPGDIYPPLKFPRVIVIAHVGTIPGRSMMLTVTRPIEQAIMEVPGIRRVRFTSPHPNDFSDRVIEAMATVETVCEHVHLPMQSGSTQVLKRMLRDRHWEGRATKIG